MIERGVLGLKIEIEFHTENLFCSLVSDERAKIDEKESVRRYVDLVEEEILRQYENEGFSIQVSRSPLEKTTGYTTSIYMECVTTSVDLESVSRIVNHIMYEVFAEGLWVVERD